MRDLEFPHDIDRENDQILERIAYWAAMSVLGEHCHKIPIPKEKNEDPVFYRLASEGLEEVVRREAASFMARYSLVAMITEMERMCGRLLLQRRYLESLDSPTARIAGRELLVIKRRATASVRGLVDCCKKLVTMRSVELEARLVWLDGINRVRNCIAHNEGLVSLEDIKRPGTSIEDVKEEDKLEVLWLTPQYSNSHGIIESLAGYVHPGGDFNVTLLETKRSWSIGERIDVTAQDCQYIAQTLQTVANHICYGLKTELNKDLVDRGFATRSAE